MATRISFSTHWPDRLGDKAGKRNHFPEKILHGMNISPDEKYQWAMKTGQQGGYFPDLLVSMGKEKTKTIRKNFEYWKSKEGKMIQPFIWAGKPRRSKQIPFCPEVLLMEVSSIQIMGDNLYLKPTKDGYMRERCVFIGEDPESRMPAFYPGYDEDGLQQFSESDGFDTTEDFFMWFNEDFEGAILKFGKDEQ